MLNILQDEINIVAFYYKGPALMPSSSIDTINMGKLNAGDYSLNFKVEAKYYNDTSHTYDMDTLNFTVSDASSLKNNTVNPNEILVYPNPTIKVLNISSNFDNTYKLELIDYLGKLVYKTAFTRETIIDVSALPAGIYIVRCMNDADNSGFMTKVIVQ
jgi:hypothetical protein